MQKNIIDTYPHSPPISRILYFSSSSVVLNESLSFFHFLSTANTSAFIILTFLNGSFYHSN